MQTIMSIILLIGFVAFGLGIIWVSLMLIIDTLVNGLGSESQRRERDRMMGDPKDRP